MSENVKESESSMLDGRGEPLTPSGSECAEIQDGVTTPSGSDIVSKSSGIPGLKTSGIKPPSKIGRPCSGQAKPALPPVPAKSMLLLYYLLLSFLTRKKLFYYF